MVESCGVAFIKIIVNLQVINKIKKTIEEIEAYKKVVDTYKFDKLNSVKWGFTPKDVPATPRSMRRFNLENRLCQCGYSMDTLKPEVREFIQRNHPGERREKIHQHLLETARKRSNFLINRKTTNEAMRKENWNFESFLKQKEEDKADFSYLL